VNIPPVDLAAMGNPEDEKEELLIGASPVAGISSHASSP
jgi:hypothetical protein